MSNYTQTTFFTPKDSLPITDPNKTIFGAAYDVEFANISASLITKLDATFTNPALISLNITGAATPANGFSLPSANTLGIYSNSTQVATIATGGTVFGGATGGAQGAGTINCTGLFVNGISVVAGGTQAVVSSGTATLSGASIAIGQTYIVWRSASANISSNAVLTADAVMQITGLPIGTYQIDSSANWTTSTSDQQGVGAGFLVTGAGSIASSGIEAFGTLFEGGSPTSPIQSGNTVGSTIFTATNGVAGTATSCFSMKGFAISQTGTITLQFAWRQAASVAANLTIQPGAWMSVTRLK